MAIGAANPVRHQVVKAFGVPIGETFVPAEHADLQKAKRGPGGAEEYFKINDHEFFSYVAVQVGLTGSDRHDRTVFSVRASRSYKTGSPEEQFVACTADLKGVILTLKQRYAGLVEDKTNPYYKSVFARSETHNFVEGIEPKSGARSIEVSCIDFLSSAAPPSSDVKLNINYSLSEAEIAIRVRRVNQIMDDQLRRKVIESGLDPSKL